MKGKWKSLLTKVTSGLLAAAVALPVSLGTLSAEVDAADTAASKRFIEWDSEWKYRDDYVDPSPGTEGWLKLDLDESEWKTGQAPFAYKNSGTAGTYPDHKTELTGDKPGTAERVPTYFFRQKFTIDDLSKYKAAEYKVTYDDALVIYINGTKVNSINLPDHTDRMDYGSISSIGNYAEEEVKSNDISYLREGENIVCIELHNDRASSSDVYFKFDYFDLLTEAVQEASGVKSVTAAPGSDETELNFSWYATSEAKGNIVIAEKGGKEEIVEAAVSEAADGYKSNKATVKNLKADTEYTYKVGNEDGWSEEYSIKTGKGSSFTFLLAGDPQIGTGDLQTGIDGWQNMVKQAVKTFSDVDFMVSAGDQVDKATNEVQYDGYFSPEELTSLPVAQSVGNHDVGANYQHHFNLSNLNNNLGKSGEAGGDYWFRYGDALFMMINSNASSTNYGVAEHKWFMEDAIKANEDAKWKVVVFHHSIYSIASHAKDNDILTRREHYVPVFDNLGIDVVLMGHDHSYTRTFQMKGDQAVSDGSANEVVNPEGTLYVTANSASGSKYYNLYEGLEDYYSASKSTRKVPSISKIDMDRESFSIKTYDVTDLNTATDEYKIVKKTEETEKPEAPGKPGSVKAAVQSEKAVKVTWGKVSQADGYEVAYKTSSASKYTTKDVKTATSFSHTGLKAGTKYQYKVRAYKMVDGKKLTGSYSSAISAVTAKKPAKVTSVKAKSAGYNSIKLTWKKVSGASGYEVLRSTKKSGTYSRVKLVTKGSTVSYTDKKAKTGTKYYYKVRAYKTVSGNKVWGSNSSIVNKKAVPSKPGSVKVKKSGTSKAKISWKKVSGASGYEIYRSTKKSSGYKKVATLKKSSKVSHTNAKLKKGTTYYYKVRAYRTVGGKKVYSSYSTVNRIKR